MGSRASMRDDDIARAEFVVDSARQAVGELMRKIEQVYLLEQLTLRLVLHDRPLAGLVSCCIHCAHSMCNWMSLLHVSLAWQASCHMESLKIRPTRKLQLSEHAVFPQCYPPPL